MSELAVRVAGFARLDWVRAGAAASRSRSSAR